jgi:hypothetical protein
MIALCPLAYFHDTFFGMEPVINTIPAFRESPGSDNIPSTVTYVIL